MKNVFDFKHSVSSYLTVVVFAVAYILTQCLVSGYEKGTPLYMIIVMIPMMIIAGGLEEAGWRYIFQPELEKKYSYSVSTIIVGVVWWLCHLPLFYVNNGAELGLNYIAYGVNVLGLSFALACIKKNTEGVWLCVSKKPEIALTKRRRPQRISVMSLTKQRIQPRNPRKKLRKRKPDWQTLLNTFVREELCDYSFTPPDSRFL